MTVRNVTVKYKTGGWIIKRVKNRKDTSLTKRVKQSTNTG